MQLIFLNASPRGKKSNTGTMMDHFLKGFAENSANSCETLYLVNYRRTMDELAEKILDAQFVIIGFPLYVDCVPGICKEFLEVLAQYKDAEKKPVLGFFGQCGFPETNHMRFVERYLEKTARRINFPYAGSIMKGGGEGQHIQPEPFLQKTFGLLFEIGKDFGQGGILNSELLKKMARPETLNHDQIKGLVPYINKMLWDAWLEENGALDKSFDTPYR